MSALISSGCSYFKLVLRRCKVRVGTLSGALGLEGGVWVLSIKRGAMSCIFTWDVQMTLLWRGLAKVIVAIISLSAFLLLAAEFFFEYLNLIPFSVEWGLILRPFINFNDFALLS